MTLLRSCYTTMARFYRDTDDECKIRWFFCDQNAPFVPNSGPFDSRNWESDPKGDGHLGEVVGANRLYYRGDPPGEFPPGFHYCGSEDQWRHGQPLPPSVPVPLNQDGIPLCCGVQDLIPTDRLFWVRPEELTGFHEGDEVQLWPEAPGTVLPATSPDGEFHPTFHVDSITGKKGLSFTRSTQFTVMHFGPINLPAGFTAYVVCRPSPVSITENRPGPNLAGSTDSQLTARRSNYTVATNGDVRTGPLSAITPGQMLCFTWKRTGDEVTLTVNGVALVSETGLTDPFLLDTVGPAMNLPLTAHPLWIGEVLIYNRTLAVDDDRQVVNYLRDRYGFD